VDNRGFAAAVRIAREEKCSVLPLFIFTHDQITRNPLKSNASVQFMCDSLDELAATVKAAGGKMFFARGDTVSILKSIKNIVAITETRDYTPYAKQRQTEIVDMCKKRGIHHELVDDIYITEPGSVLNGSKKTFQKFTPFWTTALKKAVPKPDPTLAGDPRLVPWVYSATIQGSTQVATSRPKKHNDAVQVGGRSQGLKQLASVSSDYSAAHDMLARPSSMLSAHNHFGTVSIREVYWNVPLRGEELTAFRRQLYWRDFYGHIMNDFEGLYGTGPYEFQAPKGWRRGEKEVFEAWSRGETGVPLVDAGIREMLTTGFMHNRARMVVASWLVKDKGVHWRWGERFFAQHLVDYDAAQNMMNWIWVASVLPFASAPFRRHDPETSAKRLDPDKIYLHKWLGDF
jgi:deoxyribodipyrimidine photo-lyase